MNYALVTGASRGLGAAIAIQLAEDGYAVLLNYRSNEEAALEVLHTIQDKGKTAELLPFDVANEASVDEALERWENEHPDDRISVLVNNAGVRDDNLMIFLQSEQWHKVINTTLDGFFYVTRRVLKSMLTKRNGRVINVASLSGLKGLPGQTNYSAAKAALIGATKAGPIERAKNIIPQLKQTRIWNYEDSVAGLRRILWGAMKKVVIADQCGMHADMIWSLGLDAPHGEIKMFIAVLLFCIQIYCDFSGYCDMALGISQMLGIRLMENFRVPYFSRSILEFWHRWHISLMEWFKQYVYIPLGGSHVSRYRHYMNISIVFIISGLWHGASWCFLLWGIYWGLIYILAIIMKVQTYKDDPDITRHNMSGTICSMSMVITGWAIFRSTSVSECAALLFRSVIPLTIITAVSAMVITKCVNSATMKKIGKWTLITEIGRAHV